MNKNVLGAVFKRNLVAYFSNPTGYVFICVFVLLSSFAAFWPNEFFNANLANLDQLNKLFPFIMLVFVPAITMGIWADERRQGTDELLLTVPASDLDIVCGKYLAALAIYSVSLVFSLFCNFAVLRWLGGPDVGLFVGTYVGYWLIGLGMLAVGMMASFLTGNLTVAYILGAVFNAPLVFAVWSDSIMARGTALAVKQWSIGAQFRDFGQGILSFAGLSYFLMITAVMLYLSMVLIGRRHWVRGRDWYTMALHYGVRVLALTVIVAGVSVFFRGHDLRRDVTSERLSSLSSKTVELLEELNIERPVHIDAFVSPSVPESYLQTQLNVLAMLRELEARGGNNVKLRINRPDRFGPEAERARQRYDITPRRVVTSTRGTMSEDYIFMGVAFTSGLDKVILPFIDRGIPVEYELVRSIASVTQQKRRRIGILQTDAKLYGQFNMQTMAPPRNWPIVEELEKQYEVVRVDATNPITERYDALLAVQPSSLGPEQMRNFLAAVRNGQATAIFEDPFPVFAGGVPATTEPRRPPGGMNPMMMGRQPPMPKGDAERQQLWTMLGVDFGEDKIIWHDYNPYPKLSFLEKEFVFVGAGLKGEPFNESAEISSGLQNMLFPFPGSIMKLPSSDLQFTALVRTGVEAGTVDYRDMRQRSMFGMGGGLNPNRLQVLGSMSYVLAAQIRGRLAESLPMAAEEAKEASKSEPAEAAAGAKKAAGAEPPEAKKPDTKKDEKQVPKPAPPEINVVLVADIDMLSEQFFRLREVGDVPESGIHFDFDNVTFVLNLLDSLAGDERFIEIRKRRPTHRTLTRIDERTEAARKETARTRKDLQDDFERVKEEEQKKLDESIEKMKKRFEKNQSRAGEFMASIALAQRDGQRRLEANAKRLEQEKDRKINEIETRLNMEIRQLQDWYKMWAVVLPPIPPLLVAVFVFFTRRAREKEGVSRSRLRG